MGAVLRRHPEDVGDGGVQVDRCGERIARAAFGCTWPVDEQRHVAEWFELRHHRLAPQVDPAEWPGIAFFPQVMPVIGAHDDGRVGPPIGVVEFVE